VYGINTTSNPGKNYPDRCYRITLFLWKRYSDNPDKNNPINKADPSRRQFPEKPFPSVEKAVPERDGP
jgi:hypothetical protein